MAQQKSPPPRADHPRFEWFLPSLVELAAQTGVRPVVTLTVGGFLVSGELVDGGTYFTEVAQQVESVPEAALPAAARQALAQLLGRFAAREQAHGGWENSPRAEPPHVHLLNARVFHPAGTPVPAMGSFPWRVRLDAVEGFTLRALEWDEGVIR